jgi:hypothetical protein
MAHPLAGRLAALEATTPEHGLRVVRRHEDLSWASEERELERLAFLAGLPRYRGLTVVIRRFTAAECYGEDILRGRA